MRQRAEELTMEELNAMREKVGSFDSRGFSITGFCYPLDNPMFYIKMCYAPETRTQQFAYESLEALPEESRKGIYIPRIIRVISESSSFTYMVMEFIKGKTLGEIINDDVKYEDFPKYYSSYFSKIARAVKLFLSFPVPSSQTKPGPVGGEGQAKHPLFKDLEAPIEYESIDMLEEHINNFANHLPVENNPTVTLERELHFVYSDFNRTNFIFTENGDLYIIDFDYANFLPISFMHFALEAPSIVSMEVAGQIKHEFEDLPSNNLPGMIKACSLMAMSSLRFLLPKPIDGRPLVSGSLHPRYLQGDWNPERRKPLRYGDDV